MLGCLLRFFGFLRWLGLSFFFRAGTLGGDGIRVLLLKEVKGLGGKSVCLVVCLVLWMDCGTHVRLADSMPWSGLI